MLRLLQRLTRATHWKTPTLTRIGQADETVLTALEQQMHQMGFDQEAKLRLAAEAGKSRVSTLRGAQSVLNGPTGEANVLSWRAAEKVWLYGGTLESAYAALTQLAASGIRAVVQPEHPLAIWQEHLGNYLTVSAQPAQSGISHVVALETLPVAAKTALAATEGALIRVLNAENGVDVLPLFEEISRSTNTTAAGGNASLMAMAEV